MNTQTLDVGQLSLMMPHARQDNINKFLEPINKTLVEFRINTPDRVAAFIAQVAHESGSLRYVEEIASGEAYEYRKDLGNLDEAALKAAHARGSTTGRFYKGRGLIQITGFSNYRDCGAGLALDLINQPELLCEPLNAARSAGWFWNTHGCNELADVGLFGKITKAINGGYNGAAERNALYANNLKVMQA